MGRGGSEQLFEEVERTALDTSAAHDQLDLFGRERLELLAALEAAQKSEEAQLKHHGEAHSDWIAGRLGVPFSTDEQLNQLTARLCELEDLGLVSGNVFRIWWHLTIPGISLLHQARANNYTLNGEVAG